MTAPNASDRPSAAPPESTGAYAPANSAANLVRVLDEYLADLQAGRTVDRSRLLAEHPELVSQLEPCLAGIEFIHRTAGAQPGAPAHLGDFRIVRELGRGGMGVVYEAEQISLRRRVALKVLRFGTIADEQAMQRFQREAETVAHLHHTNIVPIFAVGHEHGVHYYAMQFIEGRSLGTVLQESQTECKLVGVQDVARWGLQAAEALAHAHQRGIVHRDVKPSNLLLDAEGTVWLTDFGLAKRAAEVTLTAAGVLLGTPRYMSPEQASAVKQPVDHRTDIYSLGATLYELATRQPVFDADTPQGVITQILTAEPVPPRRIDATLPRDLETIILKCLAKEADRRYPSARSLAADLRAFLEGRPIQARRPSLAERTLRWAKKKRAAATVATLSAAASLVVLLSAIFAWQSYQASQVGRVSLTGPHLLAEVLDEGTDKVVATFPAPSPEPIALPGRSYRLQLSSAGLLSEIWPLNVERGVEQRHEVRLRNPWLWPPRELGLRPQRIDILELADRADIIITDYERQSLQRIDGRSGRPVWPTELTLTSQNRPAGQPEQSSWNSLLHSNVVGDAALVVPPPDLDGDGTRDLVMVARTSPSLVAVSGKDAKVLWWFRARPKPKDVAVNLRPAEGTGTGGVIGQPTAVDLDGDGTPDLVSVFASKFESFRDDAGKVFTAEPQSWIEAVSGKTGMSIWRASMDARWLMHDGLFSSRGTGIPDFSLTCQPRLAQLGDRQVIVCVANTMLLGFDARTGKEAWPPHELGQHPLGAPQLADLDGDGVPEAVLAHQRKSDEPVAVLRAISLKDRATLWETSFLPVANDGELESYRLVQTNRMLYLTIDLDRDGKSEVIVPTAERWTASYDKPKKTGIAVLEGATGAPHWQRWLCINQGQVQPAEAFLHGPDLDGDGCAELFVASAGEGSTNISALSGRDGRTLWRRRHSGRNAGLLRWWQPGADGWPQLIVPLSHGPGGLPVSLFLSAGTGQLTHTLKEVYNPSVADFNGDGILDLFYTVSPQGAPRMLVMQGQAPEPWKQWGHWFATSDLDSDGFDDLLQRSDQALTARSGREGRELWRTKLERMSGGGSRRPMSSPPAPWGDLDGDGTCDLVVFDMAEQRNDPRRHSYQSVAAYSGKSGARLWVADDLGIEGSSSGTRGSWSFDYPALSWCDVDGDGRAEILVIGFGNDSQKRTRTAVSVLDGRDGRLLWQLPIRAGSFGLDAISERSHMADLDGDGILDVLLWTPKGGGLQSEHGELHAVNGRTGERIWPLPAIIEDTNFSRMSPRPAVGDLDGDGKPEVVVTMSRYVGDKWPHLYDCEVIVLAGADGKPKWRFTWKSGNPDVLPPLVVDLDGNQRRYVCVGIVNQTVAKEEIVILDASGQVRRRIPMRGVLDHSGGVASAFWSHHDLDGDGKEELIYKSDGKLRATRGDEKGNLWEWPSAASSIPFDTLPKEGRLVEIQPKTRTQPATLVVWAGQQVLGLAGPTGQPRWRCQVPFAPKFGTSSPPTVHLLTAGEAPAPRVHCTWPQMPSDTIVQQAWPTKPSGAYAPRAPPPLAYAATPDLRWTRPLPWASDKQTGIMQHWTTAIFFGLGIFLVWRRGWRRLAYLLGAWLLATLGYAGLQLATRGGYLDADQHYSWEGWYWAGFTGIDLTVVGLLLLLIPVGAWRGYRWLRTRRLSTTASVTGGGP